MSTSKKTAKPKVEANEPEAPKGKDAVVAAIKKANILAVTKKTLIKEVKAGKIHPANQKLVSSIVSADAGGSIYRGGSGE